MKRTMVIVKKRYLLLAVVATVLLVALPGTAVAANAVEGPFPVTQAHFSSLVRSNVDTMWEVNASVVGSDYFDGFPWRAAQKVQGLISVNSSRLLPDGSQVTTAFTVRPKYHISIDSFGVQPDAGAAAGIAGYVVKSAGEGAPAVGDFYVVYFFDGAQGLTQPDGTIRYYPDRWFFSPAEDTPIWLRNFPRSLLQFFSSQGSSFPSLSEGDINIMNGTTLM